MKNVFYVLLLCSFYACETAPGTEKKKVITKKEITKIKSAVEIENLIEKDFELVDLNGFGFTTDIDSVQLLFNKPQASDSIRILVQIPVGKKYTKLTMVHTMIDSCKLLDIKVATVTDSSAENITFKSLSFPFSTAEYLTFNYVRLYDNGKKKTVQKIDLGGLPMTGICCF